MTKTLVGAAVALLACCSAQAETPLDNELTLIEHWLDAQRAFERIPAMSAAIVHDQDLVWSGATGYADLENRQAASADTIYGICSISKLFTGIAAMQLRDQGKFGLDDPLSDLLPWFNLQQAYPDSPPVTLEGLLTHSSGLPRESDYPYWMGPGFDFPTSQQLKAKLGEQQSIYPAHKNFQYSNLALSLVGEVVAEQSGEDYESYIRKNILKPLELDDTDTDFPTDKREPRVAVGYSAPTRDGGIDPLPRYDANGIAPAAGFASTALDLAKFASWQFRVRDGAKDEVLAPNTLKEMQRVHWIDWDWSVSWGLAFGIYRTDKRTLTGHSGGCPGFTTRLYIDPLSKYGVAVLANRNAADVSSYAQVIFDILEAKATPSEDEDHSELDDYIGHYDWAPWGGEALVMKWKDGLAITGLPSANPLQDITPLKQIEGDRFQVIRKDQSEGHEVLFERNQAGQVSGLHQHSITAPRISR